MTDDENWYQVSLRAIGDGVDPDEWTAALKLVPHYVARTGDHFHHNPRYGVHRTNVWTHEVTEDSVIPFGDQIAPLLDHLDRYRDALSALIDRPNVEAELFLGFSSGNGQGGTFFTADLLSRIATLGLGLNLDLYPPSRSLALRRYERRQTLE